MSALLVTVKSPLFVMVKGTIDARYRVDAIGKGPCAGRNDVPRVDDIDGAVVAVGSRENAASRAGVGGRQRAAAVEIDVMVGVDGREIDRIARGVGACLGVYAVYEVVDVEMADRRRSRADITGASERRRGARMR